MDNERFLKIKLQCHIWQTPSDTGDPLRFLTLLPLWEPVLPLPELSSLWFPRNLNTGQRWKVWKWETQILRPACVQAPKSDNHVDAHSELK